MILDNVTRLCEERKISICALERETGVGNGAIGKWRDGVRSPRVDTVKRVADFFGVTVDDLLSEQSGA